MGMMAQLLANKLKRYSEAWPLLQQNISIFQQTQSRHLETAQYIAFRILQNWVTHQLGEEAWETFLSKAEKDGKEAFDWLREQGLEV